MRSVKSNRPSVVGCAWPSVKSNRTPVPLDTRHRRPRQERQQGKAGCDVVSILWPRRDGPAVATKTSTITIPFAQEGSAVNVARDERDDKTVGVSPHFLDSPRSRTPPRSGGVRAKTRDNGQVCTIALCYVLKREPLSDNDQHCRQQRHPLSTPLRSYTTGAPM